MLRAATSPPGLAALVLMNGIAILTLNMHIPSLAGMSGYFDVSYGQISLSVSLYMALTAALQIVVGPISDRYGRRPVILVALGLFVLASIGCVLAQDYWTFMAFRLLQGAVITAAALSRAIVRDTSAPQEAAVRLGKIGVAMALAPMLAPLAGGVLDSVFGWRGSFVAFTLLGAGMIWVVWTDVGETNLNRSASMVAQLRKYPLIALNAGFWHYALCTAFSVGVFFVYITGVPLVATQAFGMSPVMVGAVMGLPPVGFMIGNAITTRIGPRYALATMMIAGRLITLGVLGVVLLVWSLGLAPDWLFFAAMIAIGLGNGLTLPAGNAGALSVRPDLAGTAAGLSGASQVFLGGVASAATGAVLTVLPGVVTLLSVLVAFAGIGLGLAFLARRTEHALQPRAA